MTFDPRSLERLHELGRRLPQALPKPNIPDQKTAQEKKKIHPIEKEENPDLLFRELIKASPDGNVPSHLISRLKELESHQLAQARNYQTNKTNKAHNTTTSSSKKKLSRNNTEENLYASFDRFLLEDED